MNYQFVTTDESEYKIPSAMAEKYPFLQIFMNGYRLSHLYDYTILGEIVHFYFPIRPGMVVLLRV